MVVCRVVELLIVPQPHLVGLLIVPQPYLVELLLTLLLVYFDK